MKRKKSLVLVLLSILLMTSFVLVGCGEKKETEIDSQVENDNEDEVKNDIIEVEEESGEEDNTDYSKEDNPVVTIEMQSGELIKAELYPEVAPNTVNNFISLINKGYYDGLNFHRVIPGFMIQGGDPSGDGSGGPGYGIKGEFKSNGVENTIKHNKGVLSMARTNDPDSAGSQFFIMVAKSSHLDGDYAGFGKVIEGIEVVDKIVDSETDASDKPLDPKIMKKVTVDLKGKTYEEPEIIE